MKRKNDEPRAWELQNLAETTRYAWGRWERRFDGCFVEVDLGDVAGGENSLV
jgi:hypothetical protein